MPLISEKKMRFKDWKEKTEISLFTDDQFFQMVDFKHRSPKNQLTKVMKISAVLLAQIYIIKFV